MSLVEINWQPADRQLRQFGVICLVALPAVGWLWGASTPAIAILAAIGVVLASTGWVAPRALKPFFLLLTLVTLPIGLVVGELAMLLIYFGVFVPIGIAFRIAGRDALQRRLDRRTETYWQRKAQPSDVAHYYRQS